MNNCDYDIMNYWGCCQSIDLSHYATNDDIEKLWDALEDIAISGYDDTEIWDALNEHVDNDNIHVTDDEKERWNSVSALTAQIQALQDAIVSLADRVSTLEGKMAQKADSSALTEVWDALSECCSGVTPTPDPDPQPTGDTHPWDGKKFYAEYSNGQTLSVDYASETGHEYLSEHDTHPEGYDATLMTDAWVGERVYAVTTYSFSGCSSLSSLTLAEGVEELQINFASGATSLKTLTLPSTFYGFGANSFNGMSLDSLTILAASVPTIASQTAQALFANVGEIYVPSASLAEYKSEWSDIQSKIHAIV